MVIYLFYFEKRVVVVVVEELRTILTRMYFQILHKNVRSSSMMVCGMRNDYDDDARGDSKN